MIELRDLNERLIENSCVRSIHLDIENETLKYNLLLTLSESDNYDKSKLTLYFFDVSNLSISDFGGGITQFMHLKISRVSNGFDRIRYEITDVEDNKIFFYFESLEEM